MIDTSLISTGFFAGASDDLKSFVVRLGTQSTLSNGQELLAQGVTGDTLYVVLAGTLEVSVISSDGRKLALNVMHPGDVVGEIAMFDPGPHTATVAARETCHLWGVKNADILTALHETPTMAEDLIRLAGQRMRWMGRQLNEQVFLPLPARLARKILHLTAHSKAAQPKLRISQLALADFVGTSREAVSKTMSGWSASGHIALSRGSVQVLEPDALREIADLALF